MTKLNEFFGKRTRPTLIVIGSLALASVGVLDYFAVRESLEFSVFFLVPISFLTWFVHQKSGFAASTASALIIFAANFASPLYELHPPVAYWNAMIWLGFFVLATVTIAQLRILYLGERQLSRLDSLTGIPNRLAFYELATGEMNRSQRYGEPITVAYIDLDGFKEVNDAMGHEAGDKLLIWVARTISRSIRRTDFVARVGGDEFALLLPNTTAPPAFGVIEELLANLNRRMRRNRWPVTFSVGAVTFLTPPNSLREMIRRADAAMYSAKTSGKNRLKQEEIAA
jgi:diguanylate cyclase (GGDEF)-like protein